MEDKKIFKDLGGQLANNYHYDKIEWTVYGKIKKITKSNGDIIAYTYDAAGNRASKSVTLGGVTTITWYVRDAQGNSLALYSDKQGGQSGMWWKEQSLYGSSRLGIWAPEINIASVNGTSEWSVAGKTVYELSNHLGNVLATITDKKIGHDPGNGIIDYYNADVTSSTDYYPFGMQMPGRNWSSSTYRYGFNGKENDNEVKGTGNQQDYGMRIYDPRIGRFLSVDPLTKSYPWYTPYQFAGNKPIWAVDLDGLEELPMTEITVRQIVSANLQQAMNEEKVKSQLADVIYGQINMNIPSKDELHFHDGGRYRGEKEIIINTIKQNIQVNLEGGYAAVQMPETKDPGVFYQVSKQVVSFAFNEAQPVLAQGAGVALYQVGNALVETAENVEKYKKDFYKKYFPKKFDAASKINSKPIETTGKGIKALGRFLGGVAKLLSGAGTVQLSYEVLNPNKGPISDDEIQAATEDQLKKLIDNNRQQTKE